MPIAVGMAIEHMVVGRRSLVHTAVLHLVDHELQVHEGITRCLNLNLQIGDGRTEGTAINAAETIDANGERHLSLVKARIS